MAADRPEFFLPRAEDYLTDAPELKELRDIVDGGAARIRELAAKPVSWAWTDWAPEGGVNVIAGPSGGGKSSLMFLLMLARARVGKPLTLCDRVVQPARDFRRILIVEGEHSANSTARKLIKSLSQLGLDKDPGAGDEELKRMYYIARKSVLVGDARWKLLEELIATGEISDLAVDTLARCTSGDANDEQAQIRVFDALTRAIERSGGASTVWIIAHTRKSGASDLDDISGSLQRVGQADSVILVKPNKQDGRVASATISLVKAREEPDDYPEPFDLVIPQVGQGTIRSADSGGSSRSGGSRDSGATLADEIYDFISERRQVPPTAEIASELGKRKADILSALRELEAKGLLTEREGGRGWRLADG